MRTPLLSPAQVRQQLEHLGISPNKALGQNFLVDQLALEAMMDCLQGQGLPVLEIGPGLGALTQALCASASQVVAVEKDAAMVQALASAIHCTNLAVLEGDFLQADLQDIQARLGGGAFLAAGNLPYYITTPIALRLLGEGYPIPRMVLMVQREAAQRFFARPGNRVYGPLGVLAGCGYKVEEVLHLSPASYYPQPEVHSSVILLQAKGQPLPAGFLPFLERVFAMRRKTLSNNLAAAGWSRDEAAAALAGLGIAPAARAEALEPEGLFALFQERPLR